MDSLRWFWGAPEKFDRCASSVGKRFGIMSKNKNIQKIHKSRADARKFRSSANSLWKILGSFPSQLRSLDRFWNHWKRVGRNRKVKKKNFFFFLFHQKFEKKKKKRSRAIFELAVAQPVLDFPELLWKSYIDFEIENVWNFFFFFLWLEKK